jgi:CO dehydrogenase/acetyl-CoA synthase beta subunit
MRIDSRMTDKSDISSIMMNADDKKENEDWFYNQFRQAFNDRINNTIQVTKNRDKDGTSLNKIKKGNGNLYKTELEKIEEAKTTT